VTAHASATIWGWLKWHLPIDLDQKIWRRRPFRKACQWRENVPSSLMMTF
jgi:hypothetical protein